MPEEENNTHPDQGGRGAGSIRESLQGDDPHHRRESLTLLLQAVRGDWQMPEDTYKDIPGLVAAIAKDEEEDSRHRLIAAKVLHAMDRNRLDAAMALERVRSDEQMADQLTQLTYEFRVVESPAKQVTSNQRAIAGNGKTSKKRKAKRKSKKASGNGQNTD